MQTRIAADLIAVYTARAIRCYLVIVMHTTQQWLMKKSVYLTRSGVATLELFVKNISTRVARPLLPEFAGHAPASFLRAPSNNAIWPYKTILTRQVSNIYLHHTYQWLQIFLLQSNSRRIG